jgi:hypothetical protein
MSIAVEDERTLTATLLSERILPLISGNSKARVLHLSGGSA